MNTRRDDDMLGSPEIWIGLVEVRPRKNSGILGNVEGAIVNVITWALDAKEFQKKATELMNNLDFDLINVEDAEPVKDRLQKENSFSEEIEKIILETKTNPNAIRYATFHTWGV